MRVSIVTLSFNQAQFLERALTSVLIQDYPDTEYIVVDAGSTDGSRELLARYDTQIHRLILEPDRGPADGLNKGFSRATGAIFGFLNADDVLLPGAIRTIVDFFETHPNVDVVSGHSIILDENDNSLRLGYSDRFSLTGYAYNSVVLMQASTFFRASSYNLTKKFNIDNKVAWDGELFVDMALTGARFARINHVLSGFRIHPGSITSSGRLAEMGGEYRKRMFHRILSRQPRVMDRILFGGFRLFKHLTNPRATVERFRYGPIDGRHTRAPL